MKKLISKIANAAGYEIHRAVPAGSAAVDPRPTLLVKYEVERLFPSKYKDYKSACHPLTEKPVELPASLSLKAHADLKSFATNESMRVYFKAEPFNQTYTITDGHPGSHFYSRQYMLYAAYRRCLGDQLLNGCTLLDVGCSSGYYSFHAARLKAARVVGIDARPEHEEQFRVLHKLFNIPDTCSYQNVDMEFGLEQMKETHDVVLAQGVMYHVYDHPRFLKNLYRLTNKLLVLEGGCSGQADLLCYPDIERTGHLRYSIHGPVLYPSVAWTIELLRWAGFREVIYVDIPDGIQDTWGFNRLKRVMLLALK